MGAVDRKDISGFSGYFGDQLILAKEAFDAGNHEQSLAILSEMRRRFPDMAKMSKRVLNLLLDHETFDEADAMMREGRVRYPQLDLFARGYIQVAHRRGDLEEALRRAEAVRAKFPRLAEAYSIAAACLASLGRHTEAESIIARGTQTLPNEAELHIQHARNAALRRDWPEAFRRWEVVQIRFDQQFLGPLGVAQSLKEMGRLDEAENTLKPAMERFPHIEWLSAERADVATAKGDFDEAARRWRILLARSPTFAPACLKGAEALRMIGCDAEADQILEHVVNKVRSELSVHLEYARSAHRRNEWVEAQKRWALVRERFPECVEAREQEAEALVAAERQGSH